MSNDHESDSKLTRRTVLRGAAVGASFGFTGAASAAAGGDGGTARSREPEPGVLRQKYDPAKVSADVDDVRHSELVTSYADAATVETELRANAGPVLAELAERGYLEDASLEQFDLGTVHEDVALEPADARGGVAVTSVDFDGIDTAHLGTTTTSNGYDVGLYHQPETGNTYALVEAGGDRKVVHDFDGDVGVEGDCSTDYYCSDEICCSYEMENGTATYYWEKKERCCLMADGSYSCDKSNYDCGCDTDDIPGC